MKTGALYIDGKDAYTKYGIYVVGNGYNELVAMPPLKAPETNDWHEEDGIEADLENPVLDARDISVKFAVVGLVGFGYLLELLSDKAYHTFNFAHIKRTYKLRMLSTPSMSDVYDLGFVSLKFADDFPMDGYVYKAPTTTIIESNDDYMIDNKKITDYGIVVTQGSREEMTKVPEVKKNLEQSSKYTPGRSYDEQDVKFKSKDIKLKCLLRAKTLDELWQNYDALLYDITKSGEHDLYYDTLVQDSKFYYKSCQVTEFYPTGDIWMQFTLTLTITAGLRLDSSPILATEAGVIITTEDGLNLIDLSVE